MIMTYAIASNKGCVRRQNQDNIAWNKHCLPITNNGFPRPIVIKDQFNNGILFGVFDGIGGGFRGDIAANLAAQSAARWEPGNTGIDLMSLCYDMNKTICEYSSNNSPSVCGTTAALLVFEAGMVYGCNVGDSRIYLYRNQRLTQLSEDHVFSAFKSKKPPLLQYLGLPESKMIIDPASFKRESKVGDIYLICSDGLTDMISDTDICQLFQSTDVIGKQSSLLFDKAIEAGGKDNLSFILIKLESVS